MITSHDLLDKLRNLQDRCPTVKNIIYYKDQLEKTDTSGFKDNVTLKSFEEVVEIGKSNNIPGIDKM